MSMKIAVALAATIGMAILMSSQAAEARPEMVGVRGDYTPGTIVVKTNERRLYLFSIPAAPCAIRSASARPASSGPASRRSTASTSIRHGRRRPSQARQAVLPDVIPGGSPRNPMGVAAMTLAGTEYAIHGTNMPGSVGGFVSYGCIRMYNHDIPTFISASRSARPWW